MESRCKMKATQLGMMVCFVGIVFTGFPKEAQAQTQTIYNTAMPSVIRVAIRPNNDPWAPILWVQTVGFQEYCTDVLPNEWMPSWSPEALQAGAIAVKMFAWYCTLHPTTESGWTYDVDNTTNFQEYKYMSGTPFTNQEIRQTWNLAFVPPDGEIIQLEYRAGWLDTANWSFVGTNIMSQWGSQYLGATAKLTYPQILNRYYPNYVLRGI